MYKQHSLIQIILRGVIKKNLIKKVSEISVSELSVAYRAYKRKAVFNFWIETILLLYNALA